MYSYGARDSTADFLWLLIALTLSGLGLRQSLYKQCPIYETSGRQFELSLLSRAVFENYDHQSSNPKIL